MASREASTDAALAELRAFGLTYPGAHIKSPWPGHGDLAVNDNTFAYLSVEGDPFKVSCKLPQSCDDALGLPFVAPTEYGLGKSGWVTARLEAGPVPVDMFKAWIDESYRAQAPKRLVASLGTVDPARKPVAKKAAKKAAKKPRSAASAQPRAPRAAKKQRKLSKSTARPRRAG